MLLKFSRAEFALPVQRKEWAQFLSCVIEGKLFEVYCPMERDDFFWTLDSGNDWKVKFFRDHPDHCQVTYRYHKTSLHEEALAEWLKVRTNAEIVRE